MSDSWRATWPASRKTSLQTSTASFPQSKVILKFVWSSELETEWTYAVLADLDQNGVVVIRDVTITAA